MSDCVLQDCDSSTDFRPIEHILIHEDMSPQNVAAYICRVKLLGSVASSSSLCIAKTQKLFAIRHGLALSSQHCRPNAVHTQRCARFPSKSHMINPFQSAKQQSWPSLLHRALDHSPNFGVSIRSQAFSVHSLVADAHSHRCHCPCTSD